jgi:hypothetical protein
MLESSTSAKLEMAHVLFMDIVGYSKLPIDHQQMILQTLQRITEQDISTRPTFAVRLTWLCVAATWRRLSSRSFKITVALSGIPCWVPSRA